MKIVLERFGGVGGMRWPAIIVDSSDLSADEEREFERILRTARSAPKESPESSRVRDAFTYRVTVEEGGGTTTLKGSDVPGEDFAALLRWIERHGKQRREG